MIFFYQIWDIQNLGTKKTKNEILNENVNLIRYYIKRILTKMQSIIQGMENCIEEN